MNRDGCWYFLDAFLEGFFFDAQGAFRDAISMLPSVAVSPLGLPSLRSAGVGLPTKVPNRYSPPCNDRIVKREAAEKLERTHPETTGRNDGLSNGLVL